MSTQGFTVQEFNEEDLKLNNYNFSTIIEEDEEENAEREMEVRNNLEDVGPGDISSDEDSNLSEDDDDVQRELELRNNIEDIVGPNDLSSDGEPGNTVDQNFNEYDHNEYTGGERKHPFDDDDDNSGYFPQPVSLPVSPTDLHINISHSQSSSVDEQVPNIEYNSSNILNRSDRGNKKFGDFTVDQLQFEYLQSGSDKERYQILYENRGREIDGLRAQLDLVKKTNKAESEKLNTALKMSRTKLEMVSSSEKQLKELLITYEGEVRKFNNDVIEKTGNIQDLEFANITLKSQLESTKATISSLEQHVIELKSVKSLSRSKQLHDEFLLKLNNGHKVEIDEVKVKYKDSLSKIENLKQEIVMLKSELETAGESYANTLNNKVLTIKSLQLSVQTLKADTNGPILQSLQTRNKELEVELEELQRKFDLTKKNLDCLDLVNKMRLYKEAIATDSGEDSLDIIKALDFNDLSSVDKKYQTTPLTTQSAENNLEMIVEGLKRSVFCNRKFRHENSNLQKLLCEKDKEIVKFQKIIKNQYDLNPNQNKIEEQAVQLEALNYLQNENELLNKRIKEAELEIQREKAKFDNNSDTKNAQLGNQLDGEGKQTDEGCEVGEQYTDISISLIDKYQSSLENEKLKRNELEMFYQNQIKELMDKFGNMSPSKNDVPSQEKCDAELTTLRIKIDRHVNEFATLKEEKEKLVQHYEEDIRHITDTLMDKEGEVQEVKSNLKTQASNFTTIICGLNVEQAKLNKENESLKKQLSSGREFFKGKLSEYREKYNSQQASFAKYKKKADERIDYYFKEIQRVAKGMETANLKTLDEIRCWLNSSRDNITKNIDSICVKLKQTRNSPELTKYYIDGLLVIKKLVLQLELKESENYFLYFN